MHCVAGSGYRSCDPVRGDSSTSKWQIIANIPSPPHLLTPTSPHSLTHHLLIPTPPHPLLQLMHTYREKLEHSWQKVDGSVQVRETRVYLTPAQLTLDTLTSSHIAHRWQKVGWRVHCSYLSTHTAFSSLSSSSPPKSYQAGRGKGMSHTLLPCILEHVLSMHWNTPTHRFHFLLLFVHAHPEPHTPGTVLY